MRGPIRLVALALPLLSIGAIGPAVSRAAGLAASPAQHADRGGKKAESPERSQILWDQGFELPPGSHLRFAKVTETAGPDGHTLRYRIYADAALRGIPYVLGVWHIGTAIDDLEVLSESAFVNHKGLLLANPPNPGQQDSDALNDGSELDVTFKAAKGEPVRFILHSQDWKTMIGGTLVPYPIASVSKTCKLSALLADPEARSVLVYLDGFPPNSSLALDSGPQGAAQGRALRTDARGQASVIETPSAN